MRVWDRIAGVRSSEQSVFNLYVTFGVSIIVLRKMLQSDAEPLTCSQTASR